MRNKQGMKRPGDNTVTGLEKNVEIKDISDYQPTCLPTGYIIFHLRNCAIASKRYTKTHILCQIKHFYFANVTRYRERIVLSSQCKEKALF